MNKIYRVIVTQGKEQSQRTIELQQGMGDRGQPVRIKAQADARYLVQEITPRKNTAPEYLKARRVGKDLQVIFEDETTPSLIIEDYYGIHPAGDNGLVGQAENGKTYEYIPEDPEVAGLVQMLSDKGEAVSMALGNAEVMGPSGAVAGALVPFGPLLGFGTLGAAALYDASTSTPTAPKIAVTSDKTQLAKGEKATISFTLSEASSDFTADDITVTGGQLSNFKQSATNPLVYTAELLADANASSVSVNVASNKFSNAAGLSNQDGAEADNSLTLPLNAPAAVKPVLTISDATAQEGSAATFAVSLDKAPEAPWQVSFATGLGTAQSTDIGTPLVVTYVDASGATQTLSPVNGQYTVPAGVTRLSVSVPTTNDNVVEGAETFTLSASVTDPAITATDTGTATIEDNDSPPAVVPVKPVLTISDAIVEEGSAAAFTVSLDQATTTPWEVSFATALGTAESTDIGTPLVVTYVDASGATQALTPTNGKYTVPAGVTTLSVSVPTTNDNVYEGPETFTLSANVTDPAITDTDTGTATIQDDGTATDGSDSGTTVDNDLPTLTVAGVDTVSEGSYAVFTVTLDKALEGTTPITLALSDVSTEPVDYNATYVVYTNPANISGSTLAVSSGQITLPANTTTFYVAVQSTQDSPAAFEGPEDLRLSATFAAPALQYANGVSGTVRTGASANDTSTLKDDGTGVVYGQSGSPTPGATPDNDQDLTPPKIEISSSQSKLLAGQTATITFTLSEAVSDFSLADVTITGGTLSNFQQSPTNPLLYTATMTPLANANSVGIVVGNDRFTDASSQTNQDGAEANNAASLTVTCDPIPATADLIAPTVAITRTGSGTLLGNTSETITFTLSEASETFTVNDVRVTGGMLSQFRQSTSNPLVYTALFTPTAGSKGQAYIGIAAGQFTDAMGNLNTDTYVAGTGYDADNLLTLAVDTTVANAVGPYTLAAGSSPSGNLASAQTQAITALQNYLGQANALTQLFNSFNGTLTAPDSAWTAAANDFLSAFQAGTATARIELRTGAELLNAQGAFSPTGTTGQPTIYLNADWINGGATTAAIQRVLLEEYGHYIDQRLNPIDTRGDEGQLFASRVLGDTLTSAEIQAINLEDDRLPITLDGQPLVVEAAALLFAREAYFTTTKITLEQNVATLGATVAGVKFLFVSDPPADPYYSGNNVRGYLYGIDANNNVVSEYYGEISRLIKIGSTTIGCQFYVYPNPAAPDTGTASTTIIFGVESRFDDNYQTGSIVKTSSDPVSAALNALLVVPNQAPAASPDTNTASMPSCSVAGQLLTNATGTVLTNDTDPDMQYTIDSSTTPKKLKPEVNALVVTSVTSSATGTSAVLNANSTSSSNGSTITAKYGQLTIGADGTYLYDVNELSPDLIALPQGSTITETFTYSISDGKGGTASSTLTITINGGNNAPTAVNDFKYENEVALNAIQATGNVKTNDSDIDTGDTFSVVQASGGTILSASPTTVTSAGVSQIAGTASYTYNAVSFGQGQQSGAVGKQVFVDGVATGVFVATQNNKDITFTGYVKLSTSSTITFSDGVTTPIAAGPINTLGTPSSTIFYLNNPTGTLSTGALVTGEGIASGTTVSAINGNYITLSTAATTGTTSTTLGNGEALSFLTGAIYGTYGYLNLRADGSYTYVLTKDVPNNTVVDDYFTYQIKDANGCVSTAVLQIQIQGTQVNPPTMVANLQTVTEAAVSTGTTTFNSTASVLTNDSTTVPTLKVATVWTDANTSPVTVPTGTTGTTIAGQYGTLTLKEDGTYSYALNESNATVDALRLSSETLTETFYYRAKDGQASPSYGTSTLTLTITGTNDAPVAMADTVTALEASGMDNATAGVNPTGNVLFNDTDVDKGDTKTVTAVRSGSVAGSGTAGTLGGSGTAGNYGTLVLNADGSYTYTVNNDNPTVEALKPGQTLTDSFNYTVTDATGATSTATLTVTIQGANDTVYTPDLFVNEGSPYAVFSVQAGEGQELSLALGNTPLVNGQVTDVDATLGTDTADANTQTGASLQYWNGSAWTDYNATTNGGYINVPATGTLLVRTAITNDGLADNAETFTLTATNKGGTGYTATATILDDGTGTVFANTAPTAGSGGVLSPALDTTTLPDDDRPLVVSDITVNENSPYAVFQVSGVSEQWVKLSTANGTADSGDYSSTLQYFDGTNWVTYNPATNNGYVQIPSGTDILLVRTTIVDDTTYEGPQTFTLTATNTGNLSDVGTATIVDDGTGLIYPNNTSGNPDPNAPLDDDRPLIVNNVTVNENSPYVVFTVTAVANETLTLSLQNDSDAATKNADLGIDTAATTALQYFNGTTWQTYTTGATVPTGGTMLVRLAVTDDASYEGPETYTLTAARGGATPASATGTATIVDDGTGAIFPDNTTGATDPNAVLDDDRPLGVNNVLVNENSPYTVFTVTALAGNTVYLSVVNDSSALTADATLGADTAPGVSLEYFNGTSWVAYNSTTGATVPASGNTLLVRLAVLDDTTYEGAEVFQLQATRGADTAVGTATIVDDGTGLIFPNNTTGSPDTTAALDDDRPVTVNNLVVNEASPYAVFTVKGTAGQVMTLDLLNDNDGTTNNAILGTDTAATSTLEYSLNGGTSWITYTPNSSLPPLTSDTLLVRLGITNEPVTPVYEGPETFLLSVTPSGGSAAYGTATIVDDGTGVKYPGTATNGVPTTDLTSLNDDRGITVNNLLVNEGSPYAVFTIQANENDNLTLGLQNDNSLSTANASLGVDTAATSTLQYSLNNGANWTTYTGTAFIAPTGGKVLARLAITDDVPYEGPEVFLLSVQRTTDNLTVYGTGTIVDDGSGMLFNADGTLDTTTLADDDRPLGVDNLTVNEGSGYAVFTVSGAAGQQVTLALRNDTDSSTVNADLGTDTAADSTLEYFNGTSWQPYSSGNVAIPAGNKLFVRLAIQNDSPATLEGPETFQLVATPALGGDAAIGTATIVDDGTGTKYDGTLTNGVPVTSTASLDNDKPSFTIDNVTVNEGAGTLTFTVTLTGATDLPSTVGYALSSGTATAGSDFTAGTGTLTFAAGVTTQTITVPITNDTVYEGSESFNVTLSGPTNATITDATGVGTILDDGTGTGAVTPDDDRPEFSVGDVSISEGGLMTFTVTRTGASAVSQSVNFATSIAGSNTAESGDFTATNGTLTFAPGVNTQTFTVQTTQDNPVVFEGAETFTVTLSNATNGSTITDATGIGTILDNGTGPAPYASGQSAPDDDRPVLSVSGVDNVSEGSYAVFTVTLDKALEGTTPITLALTDVSTEAVDYNAIYVVYTDPANISGSTLTVTSDQITLPPNTTTFYVAVQTTQDSPSVYEGAEDLRLSATFAAPALQYADGVSGNVRLGASANDTSTILDDGTGVVYGQNGSPTAGATPDNDKPVLTISDATVEEGSDANFTVSLDKATDAPWEVSFATALGTAESGDIGTPLVVTYQDSNNATQTLTPDANGKYTVPAGVTTLSVSVPTTNDNVYEGPETFTLSANVTDPAITDTDTGTATIKDDGTATDGSDSGTTVDNDKPVLTINDVTAEEGSAAAFTVSLDKATEAPWEVSFATALGTAESGDIGTPLVVTYQDSNNVTQTLTPVAGKYTVPAGVTQLSVSVPTTSDNVYEGSETFTLSANVTDPAITDTDTGTATIQDDGTATDGNDSGTTVDNDLPTLTVAGVDTVSEGSYAVFTVTLDKAIEGSTPITLALSDVSTEPVDYNATYMVYTDPANISGSTVTVSSGQITLPANTTTFYVAVQSTQDSPSVYEGAEDLRLTATFAAPALQYADGVSGTVRTGASANDTSTIKDDGTGVVYGQSGSPTPGATPDNDMAYIDVTAYGPVNEGSTYAMFMVKAAANDSLVLSLGNTAATTDRDASISGFTTIEYSTDGTNWTPYTWNGSTGSKPTVPASETVYVRVTVTSEDEATYEGPETFLLQATSVIDSTVTDSDTTTIVDDGSGSRYDGTVSGTTPAPTALTTGLDDDRPILSINDVVAEEGSAATFTVSLDNATLTPWGVSFATALGTAEASDITGPLTVTYVSNGNTFVLLPTNGVYTVPAGVTTLSVSVPTTGDNVYEGGETFTLSASVTDPVITATDTGTGTIQDNGTATDGNDANTTVDNDLPTLTVAGVDNVSEGSYAVFTVTLDKAIEGSTPIDLALADVTTESGDYTTYTVYTNPADISGSTLTVTGNQITLPGGAQTFYVAVKTASDAPAVYEGAENFSLTATFAAPALKFADGVSDTVRTGATANDTSTILDDGTGVAYANTGLASGASPDNDLGISVTAHEPVNEGSTYAMFTVTASAGDSLSLALSNTTSGADRDATLSGFTGLAYSVDGGSTWIPYTWNGSTGSKPTVPADGVVQVRVNVSSESDNTYEGPETFVLTATSINNSTVTANDVSTIVDDGTGSKYDGTLTGTTPTASITALDNDKPSFSVGDVSISEGGLMTFTVTRTGESAISQSVDFATSIAGGNTAESGDFTASNGTLTFGAGVSSQTFTVQTAVDAVYEGAETFTVTLSNNTAGSSIADATGIGTILDNGTGPGPFTSGQTTPDNDLPTLTVAGVDNVSEGSYAVFTVTLDKALEGTTPITLALTDDSTEPVDYNATYVVYTDPTNISGSTLTVTSGQITLPAGAQTFYVAVQSNADNVYEGAEVLRLSATFADPALQYANGVSGTVRTGASANDTSTLKDDGTGVVYGQNGSPTAGATPDNDKPVLTIGDATVEEGSNATFTVSLDKATDAPWEVSFATALGTAEAGDLGGPISVSYVSGGQTFVLLPTDGKYTVPAGVTQLSVSVPTTNDNVYEGPETFTLSANVTDPAITDTDIGTATIQDDGTATDGSDPGSTVDDDRPAFSVGDVSISEGGLMTFTVTRTGASDVSQTVDFATSIAGGNTAESGDFTASNGTLTFGAGVSSQTFTVQTTVDAVYEGAETFTVTLSNNSAGSTLADATGIGTILDDGTGPGPLAPGQTTPDTDKPVLTINDVTAEEGSAAAFTVSLDKPTEAPWEVSFATALGTAESGDIGTPLVVTYQDSNNVTQTLTPVAGKYTVPAGVTQLSVSVPTTSDNVYEGSETFTLSANVTDPAITDTDTGTATIKDDGTATDGNDSGTTVDNDLPTLTVAGVDTVSEGSYAVFTVTLDKAIEGSTPITLALTDVSTEPVDYNATYVVYTDPANIAGSTLTVSSGQITLPANTTTFYVAVQSTQDSPSAFEGPEDLRLSATFAAPALQYANGVSGTVRTGASANDTSTLKDDATGVVYGPNGTPTPGATPDDDRDSTPPTIAIASNKTALAAGDTSTITFTLSEVSLDFKLSDVAVSGGTLSNFSGSGTTYTATFTAGLTSDARTVFVDSNTFSDAAGNFNTDGADANNRVNMAGTVQTPTIAVTASKSMLTGGEPAVVTFTLSEPSTDFGLSDITVVGGRLSNFAGSGTTYTATFTPTSCSTNGFVVVSSNKFSNTSGVFNQDGLDLNNAVAFNSVASDTDTTAPTIALLADRDSLQYGETTQVTFLLSHNSTDFSQNDVLVTGGKLSNFSGSGAMYTATFTPDAGVNSAMLYVDSSKFQSVAGTANLDGLDANNALSLLIGSHGCDDIYNLNLSDVLEVAPSRCLGQYILKVEGDANDTVNLSNLLDSGQQTGTWSQSGTVSVDNQRYNLWTHSGNSQAYLLIDTDIHTVNANIA